jgi:hypothetical protein
MRGIGPFRSASDRFFHTQIARYVDAEVSPLMIVAAPSTGKTFFARQVRTDGFGCFESDDLYWRWWATIHPGKPPGPTDPIVEAMAAWSIHGASFVKDINIGTTNLNNVYLSYSSRAGFANVMYYVEDDVFEERMTSRGLSDSDKRMFREWRSTHAEQIKLINERGFPDWGIDVVIGNLDEMAYLHSTINYNALGDAKYLTRKTEVKPGKVYAASIRAAIMHFIPKYMTYVSLGPGRSEITQLSKRRTKSRCIGFYQPTKLSVGYDPKPIIHGENPEADRFETVFNILNIVGANVDQVLTLGTIKQITKRKIYMSAVTRKYSAVVYRRTFEYDLSDVTTTSKKYITLLTEELKYIRDLIKDPNCMRIVYYMVVRPIFTTPLIKHVPGKVVFLPFQPFQSTRIALFWDRKICDTWITRFSLSEMYNRITNFNYGQKHNEVLREQAFKEVCNTVIECKNFLKYKPGKNEYPVGLFSLSNTVNRRQDVMSLIKRCVKRGLCIFNLPSIVGARYIHDTPEHRYTHLGKTLVTSLDEGIVYTDHVYDHVDFWSMKDVAVYPSLDVVWRGRYYLEDHRWKVRPMPPCNGRAKLHHMWFYVGRLDESTNVQTHWNSQTHLMLPVAKLIRSCYGMDSNRVYSLRSIVAKRKDPSVISVSSSRGSYITQQGNVHAIPGHLINLMIASWFTVIDIERWFNTIIHNYQYFLSKEVRNDTQLLLQQGKLAEPDSVGKLWHHPDDFIHAIDVIKEWESQLNISLDYVYLEAIIDKIVSEYSTKLPPSDDRKILL